MDALVHLPASATLSYLVLALLVGVESTGVPLPGETALITAGYFAHRGDLQIEIVIVVAATAAIVGDNLGYLIGRKGGRRLLEARGPLLNRRLEIIRRGEPFFARYGPRAVFLGRWVAFLRIAVAWLAGISHMRWRTFLLWNALGGLAWATSVALAAYFLGTAVESVVSTVGLVGVALVAAALLAVVAVGRLRARRR
jgi:membrane protein DedA with SNARE-associated domain